MAAEHPDLVALHWMPENGDPALVHPGSGRDLLWRCPEGHTFRRVAWRMVKTQRCDRCNSLGHQSERGRLFWHPAKNGTVTPWDVGAGSDFKAWWRCTDHPHHEWPATIASFLRSKGCPFCTRDRASPEYNLATEFPDVAASWHPTSNGDLLPSDLLPRSDRVVWWRCAMGHEWDAPVKKRTSGHGCPYCSRHRVVPETSLRATHPDLAAEWHPEENGERTPEEFSAGSDRIAWWRCSSDPSHAWPARIANRTVLGTGCPYCANRLADAGNSLRTLRPDLAAEWDAERNPITPDDVFPGSSRPVWWRCRRGHRWQAPVAARALAGKGCAKCAKQTSLIEIRLFCELRVFFPDAMWKHRIDGIECDVLLPSIGVAVEYDGKHWHKGREQPDAAKNRSLGERGIRVLRVRQAPLQPIGAHDVVVPTAADHGQVVAATIDALSRSGLIVGAVLVAGLEEAARVGGFRANPQFRRLRHLLTEPMPGRSLADLHPDVAAEWDHEANAPLTPAMVLPGSAEKARWRCRHNPSHIWLARIGHRTGAGAGCPYCSGNLPDAGSNLAARHPDLGREWHASLNGDLRPDGITPGSNRKVWWLCPKDPSHVYAASPANRTKGKGCPYCAKRRPSPTDNLAVVHPALAREFDAERNGGRRPEDFRPSSGVKVWWRCGSCGTGWQASIALRARGWNGCPECAPNARPAQRGRVVVRRPSPRGSR